MWLFRYVCMNRLRGRFHVDIRNHSSRFHVQLEPQRGLAKVATDCTQDTDIRVLLPRLIETPVRVVNGQSTPLAALAWLSSVDDAAPCIGRTPAKHDEHNALLATCLAVDDLDRAKAVFYRLQEREGLRFDARLYNSFMISILRTPGAHAVDRLAPVLYFYKRMKEDGVRPNVVTYSLVLKAAAAHNAHEIAHKLYAEFLRDGYSPADLLMQHPLEAGELTVIQGWLDSWKNTSTSIGHADGLSSSFTSIPLTGMDFSTMPSDIEETSSLHTEMQIIPPPLSSKTSDWSMISKDTQPRTIEQTSVMQELRVALSGVSPEVMDKYQLQMELEARSVELAVQRFEELCKKGFVNPLGKQSIRQYIARWNADLASAIREEIQLVRANVPGPDREIYGPFLMLLKPEKLAYIALQELLMSCSSMQMVRCARMLLNIGRAIQTEYNMEQIFKNRDLLHRHFFRQQSLRTKGRLFDSTLRKFVLQLEETDRARREAWNPNWPIEVIVKVGAILIDLLMRTVKLSAEVGQDKEVPAFTHIYLYFEGRKMGIIRPHPSLEGLFQTVVRRAEFLHPRLLPMVVQPRLWIRYNAGGYLTMDSLCMRVRQCPEQLQYLRTAWQNGRLDNVLSGLDVLGCTKWRVNEQLYDVAARAWEQGETIGNMPPREDRPLPQIPHDYDKNDVSKYAFLREKRRITQLNMDLHSQKCDISYKLEIAKRFHGMDIFFPHSLDFRGRAYPIPALLNHIGSDLCRGLLVLGRGKPLGPRGLYWLKIHVANLYGMDKHTFAERIQFVEQHVDAITDSADHPLDGQRWWVSAEDPWQCLAACMELTTALRSGAPETFISHLHVHVDGSCNGLQHYAALGGDIEGAIGVNLLPSDRPQDVYSAVAAVVNTLIEKDALEHNVELAKRLLGKVTRKIVKQTVMTNVYGVTFIGARLQVEDRLMEEFPNLAMDELVPLSVYITRKVFESLRQMFTGAREIQDWLTAAAHEIARSIVPGSDANALRDGVVTWTTPLGLPIVQPYRKTKPKQIPTILQTVHMEDVDVAYPVDVKRQKAAFPPNFIHSLDASHMLMTAYACYREDIVFAAVHDSYWTHACDMDTMSRLVRETFVELHSKPIMENLRDEFIGRYGNRQVPIPGTKNSFRPVRFRSLPNRGALDLQKVRNSLYFFD